MGLMIKIIILNEVLTFYLDSILVNNYVLLKNNFYSMYTFYFFIMSCLHTTTYLPYGRFYNKIHGNHASLIHYEYIFAYLQFPALRGPYTL